MLYQNSSANNNTTAAAQASRQALLPPPLSYQPAPTQQTRSAIEQLQMSHQMRASGDARRSMGDGVGGSQSSQAAATKSALKKSSKAYAALDMRNPGGGQSLIQLQQKDKAGQILTSHERDSAIAQKIQSQGSRAMRQAGLLFDYREKFTAAEIEKFRECFTFFDREGDGAMKVEDVGLALRAMGALITGKEIAVFIKKYDSDRTGKISLDDYINILAEIDWSPDREEDIQAAFSAFDKREDGMLDLEEMKHVLSRIGDTLTPEESANFIGMIDNFGDGFARMNDLQQLIVPKNQQAINRQIGGGASSI